MPDGICIWGGIALVVAVAFVKELFGINPPQTSGNDLVPWAVPNRRFDTPDWVSTTWVIGDVGKGNWNGGTGAYRHSRNTLNPLGRSDKSGSPSTQ